MATSRSRVYSAPRRRAAPAPRRAKKPAPRRQDVKLRTRQRAEISRRMGGVLKRGMIVLAVAAIGALLVWHSHAWIQRQLDRHTPTLDLKAPAELIGVPVFNVLPKHRWLLWFPGVPLIAEHRMQKKFPSVGQAQIENHFFENRIEIYLQSRTPLVQCNGQYMDGDGVLFLLGQGMVNDVQPNAVAPNAVLKSLPQMVPAPGQPVQPLGPWLLALSRVPWLWADLAGLKENLQGSWTFTLRSGPVLLWGFSDDNVPAKAEALQKAIARAAADHGGMQRADLRFFREGRIIVEVRRPLHA